MFKPALKFFLPLCLLLMSGYSVIYAGSSQSLVTCHAIKTKVELGISKLFSNSDSEGLSIKSVAGNARKIDRIYVEENREESDEIISLRKFAAFSHYFAVFSAKPNKNFFGNIKLSLLFREHFPYYSSMRYIILRVIRI